MKFKIFMVLSVIVVIANLLSIRAELNKIERVLPILCFEQAQKSITDSTENVLKELIQLKGKE